MEVRLAHDRERTAAAQTLIREWGDPILVRGTCYPIGDCELFVAGAMEGVAAVSYREKPIAELVAINAFTRHAGIGTALLEFIISALADFEELRLTTTNDNVDALRFYQRRGFRLAALRTGAVDTARERKTTIPVVGDHGIPVHDELDLTLRLSGGKVR
jgi:GNAT superfamily N-acetyltransferase